MTSKTHYLLPSLALSLLLAFTSASYADVIKMKNGDTLNGRITYEADDIVKIEITISSSIKETKILSRNDILNIVKDAPDDVEFNKLQKILPTQSLLSAESYRTMIETGPNAFLKAYPDSTHVEPVKKIKATLEEELDKVERGFIKLGEDWISPQEKLDFEMLVNSRIRLLRMQSLSSSQNYNGYVNALREFETIEENFYGTPAFPKALALARNVIPSLGRQLQGMLRDVEFRNAEYERTKDAMDPTARAQVEAARAREEANFAAGLAADKKQGIKWVRLNPRSKSSIEGYLKLASSELKRLEVYDLEQLTTQATILEEVDKLVAKGNLPLAKVKLTEASAISGKVAGGKKSSSSKSSKRKGSYISKLNEKINTRLAETAAKEKARDEAAKSEALTANLNKVKAKQNAPSGEGETKGADGEAPESTEETKSAPKDAFAALAGKKKEAKESPKEKSSKSKPKPKPSEREERPRPVVEDSGGGISLSAIIPIITVLLLVTVVLLKVLGIGGKKEGGDE